MPILYVHGVNTRSRAGFLALKQFLARHVAPAISPDPEGVLIDDAYWGDLAATFAWNGASRPRSRLLGQGAAEGVSDLDVLTAASDPLINSRIPAAASRPTSGMLTSGTAGATTSVRLRDLDADSLSNYLAWLLKASVPDEAQRARLALQADDLARNSGFREALDAAPTADSEQELVRTHLQQSGSAFVGMGAPRWLSDFSERLSEGLRRASTLPGFAVATAAGEFRKPLNDFVSVFLGDVLVYLRTRGTPTQPGPIPQRVLTKLSELSENAKARNGEPLIVLSHSMGGQLVYDALTGFLPAHPELAHIQVDFWCATASQVGFFEEMKLFLASTPEYRTGAPGPFPPHLGAWWNVWDYNDFVSYTVRDIVQSVDDGNFDSGLSLLSAHGGYLECPSFYRRLAAKITSHLHSQ